MKRILYVACGFDGGKSGISVYMRETLVRLSAQHQVTVVVSQADRQTMPELPRVTWRVLPRFLDRAVWNMLYILLIFPWVYSPKKFDFLLLPAANRRAPFFHRFFTVAVVHDLSQYHVEAKYDCFRMFFITHILPRCVRKADRVVAISRSTAQDLQQFWQIPNEKISIVFNGYDRSLFCVEKDQDETLSLRTKYQLEKPFLLYISRIEHPGKNHLRLLKAFEALPKELQNQYDLVLGGSRWAGAETVMEYAEQSSCRNSFRGLGFVPQSELPAFYRAATLYVCPSLFEGFGIPVAEAMACGCAVACSRNSSLGEIAGDAAELFDPESVQSICEALNHCLCDEARRHELSQRGLQRVALFDWDLCTAHLLQTGDSRYAEHNRLLGITYDNVEMTDALKRISDAAAGKISPIKIAFVNADCFNQGWSNPAYRDCLKRFDAVYPDGSGVALAGRILHAPCRANVNGTDMLPLLAELAEERGFSMFLYGAAPGVAAKMRDNLLLKYPRLKICGVRDGFSPTGTVQEISAAAPDILLVAMGVPRQEFFIAKEFAALNCRVAMGVGGLFDFYSGNMPRAPHWLRKLGQEWIFRFLMEPRRMFRRYILGNPLFIGRVLRYGTGEKK